MKKILILLLCTGMLLAACGGSDVAAPTEPTVSVTEAVPQPATEAPPAAPAPAELPTEPPVSPALHNVTIFDSEDAAFLITGTENSDHLGMQLHVQCINKGSRTLMFSWDMVSVCGYMYDPFWALEVAAGKTADSSIDLDTYALEKMGIAAVDEVTFTLRIADSENWMEAPVAEVACTIYPTGLSAETFVPLPHPEAAGQVVVADDANLRFVIEGIYADDTTCRLQVYMENKTDWNLMYAWDLVSVNGCLLDPFWAASVAAEKRAYSEISFPRSELEARGISDISEIAFELTVSDYDDWETGNLLQQSCTYRP